MSKTPKTDLAAAGGQTVTREFAEKLELKNTVLMEALQLIASDSIFSIGQARVIAAAAIVKVKEQR